MSNDGQDSSSKQNDDELTTPGSLGDETGRGGSDEAANNPGKQDSNDTQPQAGQGNAAKDPEDWKTGEEPATPAQLSYISTMAVEAGEPIPTELTKAEASEKIHELQQKTGRDTSSERP